MFRRRRLGLHRRATWIDIVIERFRYAWVGED